MTKRKRINRTKILYVRVTFAELKSYHQAAQTADCNYPDWVRLTLKQAATKGKS